jgi:hypothetical protein
MTRRQVFDLVTQSDRETELFVFSQGGVVASYTLDRDYITPLELVGTTDLRKVLPLGHVLALNPDTQKVVPHFTTYGFDPVGVLLHDADAHSSDPAVPAIFRGDLLETSCWDNGTYKVVLQSTKDSLTDRIAFVKEVGSMVTFP